MISTVVFPEVASTVFQNCGLSRSEDVFELSNEMLASSAREKLSDDVVEVAVPTRVRV